MDPDLLLTTVRPRAAALGLLGFVYTRLILTLTLPTLGLAVGTAVGLRSPTVALTIIIAISSMAALAVALGMTGRLAARLVALRLVRARFYRDLLIVFGWIPLVLGAMVLQEVSISVAPLIAVFGALPLAWFVDLALIGGGDVAYGSIRHAVGALGILVPVLPLLVAGATILACRVWESEPVSSSRTHGSHSLVNEGWMERLLGDHLSKPVLTVARERWLMERRVLRGLLMTGYVLVFFGVVGFPLLLFGGPNGFLLAIAISLGMAAGIAFASDPVGTEYRTFPMLLTTVSGRNFVAGLFLSAILGGAPLVVLVTAPIGLVSVVGTVQTILITVVGVVSCACTTSVALVIGLGVQRSDLVSTPFFFTDVPIYAEYGRNGFLRIGVIFLIVLLPITPAFLGNSPFVYEPIATLGVPPLIVQISSLLLTLLLAAAVTKVVFQIAVKRFDGYQLR
ncbi:hypothetical protein [Natrinema sp. DC36]|uniref:hypothetical protein n=1 Tax=Natrinema sp. DC36 TaxID=2878680 RepID=UPI001CF097B6|nr:hypothetical protein [Natrinema sp. DC36]